MSADTNSSTSTDLVRTVMVDERLDVKARLADLRRWDAEWKQQDDLLAARVGQLNSGKPIEVQRGMQITSMRRRLRMLVVKHALEVSAAGVERVGFQGLRQNLVQQFAQLSNDDRHMWLKNFLFIMTPDLRQLNDKIAGVRRYNALGQQRNFLLGGQSGMGKTTFLDWFTCNHIPRVGRERNHVPVIKADAPVNITGPKPLFQRMLLECGLTYHPRSHEEDLLMQLVVYFQQCGVEVVIVDEIEHITKPTIRRRLLELSNLTRGVPMVCASCSPLRWVEGDVEVAGRWNDYFELRQFTGKRLQQLLAFMELLLPFTKPSSLTEVTLPEPKGSGTVDGPSLLIEKWTGGVLRDIMILLMDASARAITRGIPSLTPALLAETWQAIQTTQVTNFLATEQPRR